MTFHFDGGDILVILVSAVLFFLARRFDKNTKTYEKVRRYADKAKGELDGIVQERLQSLKDLAVDLEVQEQTNRTILERAGSAREEILSKAEELEDRVEKIEAHERALEDLNDLALRVDENLSRLKDESEYVDKVGMRLAEIHSRFDSFAEKDSERFSRFRQEALGLFGEELKSLETGMEETGRQLAMFRENLENLNVRQVQESERRISVYREELEQAEEQFRARLDKVADEGSRLEDEALTSLKDKIESRGRQLEESWKGGMSKLKNHVAHTSQDIQGQISDVKLSMEKMSGEYRDMESRLSKTVETFRTGLEKLRGRLEGILEEKETSLLEGFEKRQVEYRKTVEERFTRIEGFISDMDTLAENLKLSQQQTLAKIQDEFSLFDRQMTERRNMERAQVEEDAAALRQDMVELEEGLDELKARAYDNVSEKLQVFEDDFFADLKNRNDQMRSSMEDWQEKTEEELDHLGKKAVREREEMEMRHSAELKEELAALQSGIFGQFGQFQEQVDSFRENLSSRISVSEGDVARFREEARQQIQMDRDAMMEEFDKTYDAFRREVDGKFAKAGKTIAQRLSGFDGDIDTRQKALEAEFLAVREDLGNWKDRFAVQIDEALRSTEDRISSMEGDFNVSMTELQDEFRGKTEQLVMESEEQRAALRREIELRSEEVANLSAEITRKTRDSLDAYKEMSETFLFDFQKNSRDVRDEVEQKVRELRQSVQESREKAESTRREMIEHTDREYARLTNNLDEIEKKQRQFITETQVFKRADELKDALEYDISELGRQLEGVTRRRDEVAAINETYEKAIRLYGEVNEKMDRFLSGQKKVESLENRIAGIDSLSENVNHKLSRISETNDTLQELHIRIKQLENLQGDLDARYQRLAEKNRVLDAATEGVDANFDRVVELDTRIAGLLKQIEPLKKSVEDTLQKQKFLETGKSKMDTAVARLERLNKDIDEMDKQIDGMQRAREWLADIETRMTAVNEEAQQNVRLLEGLAKKDNRRKKSGSPDMDIRDAVIKLSRQGWDNERIARSTKLGLGEVQLILGMASRD